MKISVIIPTRSRENLLKRALECFTAQDFDASEFEIIIVDDESIESPEKMVLEFAKHVRFRILFFSQKKAGQGAARNLGVRQAKGDIVIFIGDDIFVTQNFLKEHWEAHRMHRAENEGVLGRIEWHPELEITPLMEFTTQGGAIFGKFGGHQFAYDLLEGKLEPDYNFFYTSNISLKRGLLLRNPFDPWFSGYGWEDVELGYRLTKNEDLRIFYNPKALSYHYHPLTIIDFENRMRSIGKGVLHFNEKHPEIRKIPSIKKQVLFNLISSSLSLRILKLLEKTSNKFGRNLYYYCLSKKYFLEGMAEKF